MTASPIDQRGTHNNTRSTAIKSTEPVSIICAPPLYSTVRISTIVLV